MIARRGRSLQRRLRWDLAWLAVPLAAACASGRPAAVSPDPAAVPVPDVPAARDVGARADGAAAPARAPVPFESGVASWYGPGFDGRPTASGEIFDADSLTAAHPALPFGTRVRVVHAETGLEVVVRINDRGPFAGDRIIDLSRAAAERLDLIGQGIADVVIYVIEPARGGGGPDPPGRTRLAARPGRETAAAEPARAGAVPTRATATRAPQSIVSSM